LIQRLARSRWGVGLDELAGDLECHKRTVYRDLDALMLAGFPVLSERRDNKVFYRFLENFKLGDVPFTPDEILSLAFGEDLLRTLEGTVFHDSIRSALDKIRASSAPSSRSSWHGSASRSGCCRARTATTPRCATRSTPHDCVLERRTVSMRYRTGGTGRERARDLDPYRVWYRNGALYVVGLDHDSGEVRTFAVGRIRSIEPSRRRFQVPASFDFDAYIGAAFGVVHEPPMRVRILFDPRWADWVAERTWHATQKLERRGRSLELTMEVGGAAEVRSWVLSFGAGAEVLEPESLRSDVQKELEKAVARYR